MLNRSGPLSHALPGIGVWLGRLVGADDVIAVRVFFLVLAVLSVYAVYLLGRETLRARWAGVAAALALVSLGGFVHYATDGPREKTPMVLFLALALLATVRRRWWWAGFWVSIGTLTFQPGFASAIVGVAAGVLLLEERGRRPRAAVAVTVSGLLPLAAFLVWYAALGELRYFLDCFVLIHVRYTEQSGALTHLTWTWEELDRGYGATRWVLVLGTAAIVAGALWVASRAALRADPRGRAVLVLGIATLGGLVWSVRAFNGWPDAFILVPMTAVGVPVLLTPLVGARDSRRAILVTAGWAVVALALAVTFALGRRTDDLTRQREQAAAVEEVLGPDATYLSMEGPAFLVLTDRVNPLRDQMYGLGLTDYIDATRPGGLAGVAGWVEEQRPTLITKGRFTDNDWIQPVLERDYERCARDLETSWWVSTTAGPEACARIGEIVGKAPR
ncbi:MAG: glycosyltransferase family 39 protein [Nocardioides sp.]